MSAITVGVSCIDCQVSYDQTFPAWESGPWYKLVWMICGHCGSKNLVLTMFRRDLAIMGGYE